MIRIGTLVYGHCGGLFGRDFYPSEGARIEALGYDWVVVRDVDTGRVSFADCEPERLEGHLTKPEDD